MTSPGVDGRFLRAGAREPDSIAVLHGDRSTSYAELAELTARVRSGLVRRGVRRGDTVGVCLARGPELLAVLLGVLSAGAAYVPLDPHYPGERLGFLARDAALAVVVAGRDHNEGLAGLAVPVVPADQFLAAPEDTPRREPVRHGQDDLAYVIYTSGSTGRPKGVEVTHGNLAAFLDAMTNLLPADAGARVLFNTRLSFDIAGLEIFLPLTTGGTCVVAPETWALSARATARLINSTSPTLVQATPVVWKLLLDNGVRLAPGQTALCGGDVLPSALARRLAQLPVPAINLYGPTEATIWATAWRITSGRPMIGRPLDHATVYVLDSAGQPVPGGVEGEAYLGGAAVARGYRGRPALTAARFVPDPWSDRPGARMYATGDIVRIIDGEIEFLRRRDTQVKINGNRVELGEIESVAEAVAGVRGAVAVVTGGLRLYVESDVDTDTGRRALRDALAARLVEALPPVMRPEGIEIVTALPVTANGKLDRGALTRHAGTTRRGDEKP